MCGCGGANRSAQQAPRERLRPQSGNNGRRVASDPGGFVWQPPQRGKAPDPTPAAAPRR